VVDGHALTGRRLFAVIDPGYPDGIKVDAAGLVYCARPAGVQVFDPNGQLVDELPVPGAVNLAFVNSTPPTRIFITADTAVWAATIPDSPKEA
jgi:gluconolactonase